MSVSASKNELISAGAKTRILVFSDSPLPLGRLTSYLKHNHDDCHSLPKLSD
jgi:hypothetical protein